MSKIPTKLSRKSERSVMTDIDWRAHIDALGTKPFAPNNNESRIAVAAEIVGVAASKIRSLFYQEVADPKFKLGSTIKTLAEQQAARFEAVAASLEAKDHEFYLEEITRLRALARRVRGTED